MYANQLWPNCLALFLQAFFRLSNQRATARGTTQEIRTKQQIKTQIGKQVSFDNADFLRIYARFALMTLDQHRRG